jgi:hypothetical protein
VDHGRVDVGVGIEVELTRIKRLPKMSTPPGILTPNLRIKDG